ncbi:lipopolysaccharide biosynthesis protein [Actinokineospora sp. G85]|uniref:lipopolysaccharide biosynthesis protein n=1 Tax=Actinokineospora sp. G85 TaxID=3406626 RepID=UPI003C79501C
MSGGVRERFGSAFGMTVGMVVVGLAGYGFISLSGHTLSPDDVVALTSFYLLLSIVGPGVFAGLEQETSRSTSSWLVAGRPFGVVAKRAALLSGALTAVVLVVMLAASPLITDRALGGQWGLFAALAVGVVSSALAYLVRGLLGGRQRFSGYAVSLCGEGLSRIALCGAVVLLGFRDPVVYGLVFALGLAFSAFVALPWLRAKHDKPLDALPDDLAGDRPDTVKDMARGLGLLVGATLGFQAVANIAPVVVNSRMTDDANTAAAFASAFLMVRVPVLLFAAVQAMLMPALTQAVARGDLGTVRSTLARIGAALAAIGVPTFIGALLLGPWAVEFLFDAKVRLPGIVIALLAVSTVLLMVTQVLLPALVAIGKHRVVTIGWTAGGIVLLAFALLHPDPVWGAVWGQMASCGLVVAAMGLRLAAGLRGSGSAAVPPAPVTAA